MCSLKRCASAAVLALLCSVHAAAAPLVVGVGAEVDDADSRSFTAFVDVGVAENTWLSAAIAATETDREPLDVSATFGEIALDHHFKPVGVRVGIGYWGDADLLESVDTRAAVYLRGARGSLSLDYQRRDFDLTIGARLLDQPRRVDFHANGIGLSASLPLGERVRLYAGGMSYDYSRNIRLQPNVDRLRLFALSGLSVVNSLVDYRANVGLELSFGQRSLDFRYARWRTEADQGSVDSIGVGYLTPLGGAADLEFRATYDDSENFGGATVLSLFLYFYAN